MNKRLLLSTVLGIATAFGVAQGSFALSANQHISGVLAPATSVSVKTAGQVLQLIFQLLVH